jgi:hypothetical protein
MAEAVSFVGGLISPIKRKREIQTAHPENLERQEEAIALRAWTARGPG